MKQILISIAAATLALTATMMGWAAELSPADQQNWTTYSNARFFFSVDVPGDGIIALAPPENGDGQAWASADGLVEISAYGAHWSASAADFTGYEALERSFVVSDGASIAYRRLGDNWFVHSGYLSDGRIFYNKAVALPGCDIAAHIHLVYPETLKDVMDGIVERMARTLGPSVAVC